MFALKLTGPGLTEILLGAGTLVHSRPALIVFWVLFLIALGELKSLLTSGSVLILLKIPSLALLLLVNVFLRAGFMGSLDILWKMKRWNLLSVWECGKRYFGRFLIVGILQATVFIPGFMVLFLIVGLGRGLFLLPVAYLFFFAGAVLMFFMMFAFPLIIVEEARPLPAIMISFRIVRVNWPQVLIMLVLFGGAPWLIAYGLRKLWSTLDITFVGLADILGRAIEGYGSLLMMVALIYFSHRLKQHPTED